MTTHLTSSSTRGYSRWVVKVVSLTIEEIEAGKIESILGRSYDHLAHPWVQVLSQERLTMRNQATLAHPRPPCRYQGVGTEVNEITPESTPTFTPTSARKGAKDATCPTNGA